MNKNAESKRYPEGGKIFMSIFSVDNIIIHFILLIKELTFPGLTAVASTHIDVLVQDCSNSNALAME